MDETKTGSATRETRLLYYNHAHYLMFVLSQFVFSAMLGSNPKGLFGHRHDILMTKPKDAFSRPLDGVCVCARGDPLPGDGLLNGILGPFLSLSFSVSRCWTQCCQMAKFDPSLSLDCTGLEGVRAQSKERKGSNFAA